MADPVLDGRTIFTTARLRLGGFRSDDLPLFAEMNADPEVMRYLGDDLLTPKQSDALAIGAQVCLVERNFGQIAVERIADGAFLGTCGLSSATPWYPEDLQVGWRFARAHWGQGYATEAATPWLAHAFITLRLERLLSVADTPNLRSIAVMQRLGFEFDHAAELVDEGGRFEAVVYALSAGRWRAASLTEHTT